MNTGQRQTSHQPQDRANHKRFQSTGGLNQTGSSNIAGDYKKKNALASMQNVSHDNFAQGQPGGQGEQQNMAYQGNGDPTLGGAAGAAS